MLRAHGLDDSALLRFTPPAHLVETPRGRTVLVVQTIDSQGHSSPELLKSSFAAGLALLESVSPRGRIWLPLIGTGAAGFTHEQAAAALKDVLSAWSPGRTTLVELSAPDMEVFERVAEAWPTLPVALSGASGAALALSAAHVNSHVARALAAARVLADRRSEAVGPVHVIDAVLSLGGESASFARFRELSRLDATPEVALPGRWPPTSASDLTEDLRAQLTWAQQHRGAASGRALWGRDLVTAALLCDDPRLHARLGGGDASLEHLRELWFGYVISDGKGRSAEEWRAWWTAMNRSLPGPRSAGYSTETDQGDDKLGVVSEAAGFARLILDAKVEPPLSIGLMGDWGSGKSFFIEEIKRQIKAMKGQPGLHENIVQIEFNAWHASDTNLWASLVTYIFDEIWKCAASSETQGTAAAARKRLREAIEEADGAVREAEAEVVQARKVLEVAEKKVEELGKDLTLQRVVAASDIDELRAAAESAGFHETLKDIDDVEAAVHRLSTSSDRLRLLLSTMLRSPGRYASLAALALLLMFCGWLGVEQFGLSEAVEQMTQRMLGAVGVIGALVAPLVAAGGKLEALRERLGGIVDKYDERRLAPKRRELESAKENEATARARLAELRNQQAALDPGRRLGAFLQERVQSTTYRSQQGIISLVHKDFRQLSDKMREWRRERAESSQRASRADSEGIEPIDRIILYVDDLDRCRPQQVVQMLEAVHLLLALDLFVVVVAVDSRWLTRALQVHYRELLTSVEDGVEGDGLRRSTAQNYLEKIFQITYALAPIDPKMFTGYIRFLAGAEEDPTTPDKATGRRPEGAGEVRARRAGSAEPARDAAPPDRARRELAAARSPEPTPRAAPRPRPVRIDRREQDFLAGLAPLLPTPRIAKRLVNVYRLIKASKSVEELHEYDRSERHRSTLLMLAILFGRPAIAPEMFRRLHEGGDPFTNPDEPLTDALRRLPKHLLPGAIALADELRSMNVALTVAECAREPKDVARYSLVTGHEWHTWRTRKC